MVDSCALDVGAVAFGGRIVHGRQQPLAEIGRLRQCLEQLAPAAHELVRLRYFGEHLPEQIANLRSQSVYAVHVTLSRARAALRKCLEQRAEFSHE